MGQVWQATDTQLGREVALKILPDAFATDPDRLSRFQREAQVLASLNHPNIAQIHGIEEAEGTRALVLELVEGPTLADRIARGPIPLDEVLPIARQIAEALEAAHEAEIIHRDLKPSNIKVREDGTVKVLDFGLAKALEGDVGGNPAESPTLTAAATKMGVIIGTAAYMSPEQASGETADRRSDIWSFGVVLFEMLTGQQLFTGKTVSHVLAKVLERDLDFTMLPTSTPAPIRRLVRRCLEREQKRRLRDVGEALSYLEEAATRPEVTLPPPAPISSTRRLPVLWLAAASVTAALVTGVAVWTLRPVPPGPPMRFVVSAPPSPVPGRLRSGTARAISPDGRVIVYGATVDGEEGLYVRHLDRLEGVLLTNMAAGSVFFSPAGAWVGFSTGVDRTLKKIPVTGGPAITLCPMPTPPRGASWGPDDTIIFAKFGAWSGLFRVSAAGGEPEMLTRPDAPERHYWPEVLPGGRAVLFSVGTGQNTPDVGQIAVLDLETGEQQVLIQGGAQPRYVSSGHLVYRFADTLRAVRFDADRLEVLGDPIPVLDGVAVGAGGGANVDISDDGTLVYQRGGAQGGARTLVWVDRAGREEPVEAEARPYEGVRLSPDGRQVAVVVADPENTDVLIYDLARGTPTRLTFDPARDDYAIWSPDGQRVVFASTRNGGVFNLFWKAADGTGEVERLTTSERYHASSSWAGAGQPLVYFDRFPDTAGDISALSMDGERVPELVLQEPFNQAYPEVSPDGRWIAYYSNESGQPEIYVRPFPNVNAGKWQVSRDGGTRPVWAPDGRGLFYLGLDFAMKVVPVESEPTFSPGIAEVLFDARDILGGGDSAFWSSL